LKKSKRIWISCVLAISLLIQGLFPISTPNTVHALDPTCIAPDQAIQSMVGNKARYDPGEQVELTLKFTQTAEWCGMLQIEVYHINNLVAEGTKEITVLQQGSNEQKLNWTPPNVDFRGYLVKAYFVGKEADFRTAAIDVFSNWTQYPRYGYTTELGFFHCGCISENTIWDMICNPFILLPE